MREEKCVACAAPAPYFNVQRSQKNLCLFRLKLDSPAIFSYEEGNGW